MFTFQRIRSSRGAMLVHVGIVMIALMAFTALVYDYGVLYVSRRQAQNAADAAALAAAISLSFVDITDQALAQNSAVAAAQRNQIWGLAPNILTTDVTIPACPPGAPGVAGTCVRADVFRTNYQRGAGSPLPTFFANLVGVTEQGVRATATAQMLAGSGTSECVKPWGIPDKWLEIQSPAWDPADTFDRYIQNGNNAGQLLAQPDVYTAPSASSSGTGFSLPTDYGLQITLKSGNPQQAIAPGWFFPVVIDPSQPPGGARYRDAIEGCAAVPINPGDTLTVEPGSMIGPTRQGVNALIAQDLGASWNTSANGGLGAPVGGCMSASTCGRSPRLVAIPVFDVDAYDSGRASGRVDIIVTQVLGFWIEGMQGNDVIGYLMNYPTTAITGAPLGGGASAFANTVILVR